LKINYTEEIVNKLVNYYKADSSLDLFHGIAEGKYDVQKVREAMLPTPKPEEIKPPSKPVPPGSSSCRENGGKGTYHYS
jgi:hypothetical protein